VMDDDLPVAIGKGGRGVAASAPDFSNYVFGTVDPAVLDALFAGGVLDDCQFGWPNDRRPSAADHADHECAEGDRCWRKGIHECWCGATIEKPS
jgi:hypothetical protein